MMDKFVVNGATTLKSSMTITGNDDVGAAAGYGLNVSFNVSLAGELYAWADYLAHWMPLASPPGILCGDMSGPRS